MELGGSLLSGKDVGAQTGTSVHGLHALDKSMGDNEDGNPHPVDRPFDPGEGQNSQVFVSCGKGKSAFPKVKDISNKIEGKFVISIPDVVIDHNISLMAFTLVGKFVGPRPNIENVRVFAKNKWHLKGQVDILALPKGFFAFSFSCSEYFEGVLCGGLWMFGKTSLTLRKWAPKLELKASSFFYLALVWVRLFGFPLEFWFEDVFKGIASSFGELLAMDPMIAARKRHWARGCPSNPKNASKNIGAQKKIWKEKPGKDDEWSNGPRLQAPEIPAIGNKVNKEG
ncbi:uncharacterized protein LOC131858857 [Cryptomeria japonica]|uniref:uncharacterized protein LOC131858857 n=1 Tax=Cryptomeria japonica TaxID=3369 RepID=UPI0027DA8D0F|nr:uncharacterized protein LOC131858857 [Cryptomeria japonica]